MTQETGPGKDERKVAGGHARAEALSPEQRQSIARKAAQARWDLPRAIRDGTLKIGGADIACYVVEIDGAVERVLSTRGIMRALKRTWRGRKYTGTELPVFLEATNLKRFISGELGPVLSPVFFLTDKGAKAEGYRAEILPAICEVYLRARDQGDVLTATQAVIAKQCEVLVRGLSRVGIIALVDEATGYEEIRDRLALQVILDRFLRKELAAWAKRFPDEFYQQMFRLRGWKWKGMAVNRPQVVGHYTKDLIYARLAPGIIEQLEKLNPRDERGQRKAKHHQWLTEDVGHPALAQHLYAVIGFMRASASWDSFVKMLDRAFPRRDDKQMRLLLDGPSGPA